MVAWVTQPFCGGCTRARLSADGRLYTCLFATGGYDIRPLVRSADSDEELQAALVRVWSGRADRYSELRSVSTPHLPKVEMSFIGG